jgi:hypothetical protein
LSQNSAPLAHRKTYSISVHPGSASSVRWNMVGKVGRVAAGDGDAGERRVESFDRPPVAVRSSERTRSSMVNFAPIF